MVQQQLTIYSSTGVFDGTGLTLIDRGIEPKRKDDKTLGAISKVIFMTTIIIL